MMRYTMPALLGALLLCAAMPVHALPPGYCASLGREAAQLVRLRDLQVDPAEVLAMYATNRAKHGLAGEVDHVAFEQWMVQMAFEPPFLDAQALEAMVTTRCQLTLR